MDENNKNFFWGVLLGAVAAALAGAVALSRSFRGSKDGAKTFAPAAGRKGGPAPRRSRSSTGPAKKNVRRKA